MLSVECARNSTCSQCHDQWLGFFHLGGYDRWTVWEISSFWFSFISNYLTYITSLSWSIVVSWCTNDAQMMHICTCVTWIAPHLAHCVSKGPLYLLSSHHRRSWWPLGWSFFPQCTAVAAPGQCTPLAWECSCARVKPGPGCSKMRQNLVVEPVFAVPHVLSSTEWHPLKGPEKKH